MQRGRLIPFFLVVLLVSVDPALGQTFYGDKKYGEFYEEEKQWVEQETEIPDFPRPGNLIEYDVGAATSNRHFIDGSSLSVGKDSVVRFVTVVKTAGGATNIHYEGIRCGAKTRKLYAIGRTDNTWAKPRTQDWQPIRPGSYQAILSKEYFCPNNAVIFKAEDGVNALKHGGHPDTK